MQSSLNFKTRLFHVFALTPLCTTPILSIAGDLEIEASVDSTGYVYQTKSEVSETQNNHALVIAPAILASFSSKRLLTSVKVEHTKVEQKTNLEGADKNYTDYQYNGILTLIPNSLNVSIGGQQAYRVVDSRQEFVSDRILSAGDLTKYNRNSGTIDFTIPNPKYFGLNIRSSYSKTETEETIDGSNGLNGDNTAISAQLYQGRKAKSYTFNLSAQHNETSRRDSNDFKSSLVQGSVGFSLFQNLSFVIDGNIEDYDVNQATLSRRQNLNTSSYGAGFEWQPRNERKLRLTYNQLEEGQGETLSTTNFIGVNIDWAFTNRTDLQFDYGKRFYGDAYNFSLSHALKNVRSSIVYSEEVTTYYQLVSGETNVIGLFVCQFGSTELTDCFQAENTDYQLQAGEEFRTYSEVETDISEEILFRKSGTFNLSYDRRKIKASLSASYAKTEYLESNRIQTNRTIRANLVYELGRKNQLSFAASLGERQFNEIAAPDTITTISLDFKRDLEKDLKLTIGTRYLDRDSDNLQRNISDRRFTVGLNYSF